MHLTTPHAAHAAFDQLCSPLPPRDFFETYWQRRSIHFSDTVESAKRLSAFLGLGVGPETFLRLASDRPLDWGTQVNAARTKNGVRTTLNGPSGTTATYKVLRKMFDGGATLQFLHPQQKLPTIAAMCAQLEECFGSVVGCNAYLTPSLVGRPSQGFAPHGDDVDVFVLQICGTKQWEVCDLDVSNALPRTSSDDYPVGRVPPVTLTPLLNPGDVLYMPRGAVHSARTMPSSSSEPSLHLTISTYQQWCWADLLQTAAAVAVDKAAERLVQLRVGLPLQMGRVLGAGPAAASQNGSKALKVRPWCECGECSQPTDTQGSSRASVVSPSGNSRIVAPAWNTGLRMCLHAARREALANARLCMGAVMEDALDEAVDAAADHMGLRFVDMRMPPPPVKDSPVMVGVKEVPLFDKNVHTYIRVRGPSTHFRVVVEDGEVHVFCSHDNAASTHAGVGGAGIGNDAAEEGGARRLEPSLPLSKVSAISSFVFSWPQWTSRASIDGAVFAMLASASLLEGRVDNPEERLCSLVDGCESTPVFFGSAKRPRSTGDDSGAVVRRKRKRPVKSGKVQGM